MSTTAVLSNVPTTLHPVPFEILSNSSQILYLGCDIPGFEKVDMVFDLQRQALRLQFKSVEESRDFEKRLNFSSDGRLGAIFYRKDNEKEKPYFGIPIFFESSDALPPAQTFPFFVNLLKTAIMEEIIKKPFSSDTVSSGFDLLGVQQIFTTQYNNRPALFLDFISVKQCSDFVNKLNFNEEGRQGAAFYTSPDLQKNWVIFSSIDSIVPLRASFLFALLQTAVKEVITSAFISSDRSGQQPKKNKVRERKYEIVK